MPGVDLPVLALVLLAAVAHSAWNGWLKKSSPDFAGLAAMSIGWLILGAIGLLFVGLPDGSHWPYLLLTTVVHTIYAALLVNAYRHGELSLTYPIARGTGPLIVVLAAPFLLHETLEGPDVIAVALIVAGVLLIGLAGTDASLRERHAILLSLATGVAIAVYTLIDAAGARAGPSPHTYSAWLFVLTAVALLAVTGFLHRSETRDLHTIAAAPSPWDSRRHSVSRGVFYRVVGDDGRTRSTGCCRSGDEHSVCGADWLEISWREHYQAQVVRCGAYCGRAGRREIVNRDLSSETGCRTLLFQHAPDHQRCGKQHDAKNEGRSLKHATQLQIENAQQVSWNNIHKLRRQHCKLRERFSRDYCTGYKRRWQRQPSYPHPAPDAGNYPGREAFIQHRLRPE